MSEIEKICRPLVRSLCEYWYYSRRGFELDMAAVEHSLREHLIRIRETVEDNGHLKREFRRIEQPLVFFIDYTIKEGNFSFSGDWREIARDYNELSGDEKFFEQLADSLDDPDSSEQLLMYYLFMGLGFDGCHAGDKEYIQRRMKVCAARFLIAETASPESLSSQDVNENAAFFNKKKFRFFSVYTGLAACAVLMLAALIFNLCALYGEIKDFRASLFNAVFAAEKIYLNRTPENNTANQKGHNL